MARVQRNLHQDGIQGVEIQIKCLSGRKNVNRDNILKKVACIPFPRRTNQRSLPEELHVSRSVVRDAITHRNIIRLTSTIHPLQTRKNKLTRLRYVFNHVVHGYTSPMYNIVLHASRRNPISSPAQKQEIHREDYVSTYYRSTKIYKRYIIDTLFLLSSLPGRNVNEQGNATPHAINNDPDVRWAGLSDGWNIRVKYQPPNSLDLNVVDLGYVSSVESL
ncbi:hypothetical protein PHMEG_00019984 [Phytophthora megakarya]|uniref:Transposase n=1 Tax=Phytophthora megakarya TaxID=4795 RepID=A0A225VPZ1_9STRA|nr:hypothetical protein PHMEG_00019984 [Phytophthora megakarya]